MTTLEAQKDTDFMALQNQSLSERVTKVEEENAALAYRVKLFTDACQRLYNSNEHGRGIVMEFFGFTVQPSNQLDQALRP